MEDAERTPFGKRLYDARAYAKLTQAQAAKAVGMAQGTLAEAEVFGKRSGYAVQIAALYKVDAGWLATGKGEMRLNKGGDNDNVTPETEKRDVRDPLLDDLAALEADEAVLWQSRIDEAQATLKRLHHEIRAAANKTRRKQKEEQSIQREDKPPGEYPNQERRRTSR